MGKGGVLVLGLSLCGLGICPRTSAGGGGPSHLLSSPVSLVVGSFSFSTPIICTRPSFPLYNN